MNVLFLTLNNLENINKRGMYPDLFREFRDRGNNIYIVCPSQRRFKKSTELIKEQNVNILRVKTGNITKTNLVEKGFSTLLIESQFIKAINKYFNSVKFDLIIYSTPPITFERVVKLIKNRDNAVTYLLLKDIFPQNSVDIGLLKKGGILWRYFRAKEKKIYNISDYIGCMSEANVNYILKHNPEITPKKVEVCPNSIKPYPLKNKNIKEKQTLKDKYDIPDDAVVFIYGGNLGKPQGVPFLLKVMDELQNRTDLYILIVGSGTEYDKIKNHIELMKYKNANLFSYLPKQEYDDLLKCCDVGMIFLDSRFTIPNFPSRLTAYMEAALPVIAATDENTDIKDVLYEANCGMWSKNGDLDTFINNVNKMIDAPDLRKSMGVNGRKCLENNYTVDKAYEIITSHI